MATTRRSSSNSLFQYFVALILFFSILQLYDPFSAIDEIPQSTVQEHLGDFRRVISKESPSRQRALQDKEELVRILSEAGVDVGELPLDTLERLPTQSTLTRLYGNFSEPPIWGLEHCTAYREKVQRADRFVGVAGLFNTGTNLLAHHLENNLDMSMRWQVPWGKHRLASVKYNHTARGAHKDRKDWILPIVMIRDPFSWMQSMCAHQYATRWRHSEQHCPNLIPSESDRAQYKHLQDTFQVSVKFDGEHITSFTSLAHLWTEWYREYVDSTEPFVLIRFEDMVLRPRVVLQQLADCVETTVKEPFRYQVASSKDHGSHTDLVKAILKTGDAQLRLHNLTSADLDYAHAHLDEKLMHYFGYDTDTAAYSTLGV